MMVDVEKKMKNQVVHFEIPVENVEAAKKFYSIFDWEMNDMPGMDYVGIRTTPVGEGGMPLEPGGINGGMMKRVEGVRSPVFAVQVSSVDLYVEKVIAGGGKLVVPKMEIPGMGYYAYVADPEENVLGLWEPMG